MKTITKIAALSLLLTAPAISFAEGEAAAPAAAAAHSSKLNPWVDCGIGAMIFSDTKWAAVSSNIIWDLGTTAVISAGVSENTCEGSRVVAAARFITETYANIEEETVQGEGQHVTAMLNILGCESASHAGIITAVRADFGATVGQSDYLQKTAQAKAEAYYNIVEAKATGEYAQSCQAI